MLIEACMDYKNMENYYLIISKDEIAKVNFNELAVSSFATCLYIDNGEKLVLKWRGETPSFINLIQYKEGPYDKSEIKNIIKNRNPKILSLSTS